MLNAGQVYSSGTEDEYLEPLDSARRDHFGEQYDPVKYRACQKEAKPGDMSCTPLKLVRNVIPVHYPYPDVPPPKLPEAPAGSVYQEGWSAQEYFEHLCQTEGGKFIYRTVEGVEGVFQMRPREVASDYVLRDRYVMQDPFGYRLSEAAFPGYSFVGPGGYQFFETTLYEQQFSKITLRNYHASFANTPEAQHKYVYYSGFDGHEKETMTKTYVEGLRSRYGYMWRDIKRPKDREFGIGGGELIVLALQTNEILAIWRGFARTGKRAWWLNPLTCPPRVNHHQDLFELVRSVLAPVEQRQ